MELKNAVAVCLISLFSATLVVLIARSLDNQAAMQLEPRLAEIADELKAIRRQGGIAAVGENSAGAESLADGLTVYYFHGNTRCPTCRSIESQSKDAVEKYFAAQLDEGRLAWKIVNYEQSAAKPLAKKFAIDSPVVVLARTEAGEVADWKRLDEVLPLESDKPAFAKFMQEAIEKMLDRAEQPTGDPPAIPLP